MGSSHVIGIGFTCNRHSRISRGIGGSGELSREFSGDELGARTPSGGAEKVAARKVTIFGTALRASGDATFHVNRDPIV